MRHAMERAAHPICPSAAHIGNHKQQHWHGERARRWRLRFLDGRAGVQQRGMRGTVCTGSYGVCVGGLEGQLTPP